MNPAAFDLEKPGTRQLLSRALTKPERLNLKYHRERVTHAASRQVASHYGIDKG